MKVYYDGLCHLCSKEINHYRSLNGAEQIQFIDITSAEFSAEAEGLDPYAVHKVMHVRDDEGQIHKRVDAFIQIWQKLPKYQWAARIAEKAPVKAVLEVGYSAFAAARPYLPKKAKADCSESPYCSVHSEKI